jgi:hypothetical protein
MLAGFVISSLWVLTAMFGLFHLSEVGFLAGVAEQASFFAARSEFVGLRGTRSARFIAASAGAAEVLTVQTEDSGTGRICRVSLAYRSELPFGAEDLRSPMRGVTAIPPRSSE